MRRLRLLPLLCLAGLAGFSGFAGVALAQELGGEFRITSETLGDQVQPAVAMDRYGRFAAVWGSFNPAIGTSVRVFSAAGLPLTGDDVQVGPAAGDEPGPFSVSLDDAGISVAWDGYTQRSGFKAYFRRLDRDSAPRSQEIHLGRKANPSVASDRRGRSIVLAGDGPGIQAWRFDPLGRPLGKPFRIARSGAAPAVVRGAGGGFIAAWSTGTGIAGSLLDASGRPAAPFRVVEEQARTTPSLAASPDGRFVVAWESPGGLRMRLFRASGAPRTGILHVTDGDVLLKGPISVAMDAAGRILAVWSVCDPSFRGCHVFGQFFQGSGNPAGGPFQIDSEAHGYGVVAAAGPAGRFVAVWMRNTEETGNLIHGRLLAWPLPDDAGP